MALKKEEIFKKKPSKEETTYHSAVDLMNAVECVERFERKVDALRDAAARFEQLGDYQDAKQRKNDCLELADAEEEKGCRDTFELAVRKKEAASTKSHYIDAIEEFRRLRAYEPYRDKAKKEIQECKRRIQRLETIAAYKRRCIVCVVLVLIAAGLTQTPVYPVAKGIVHRFRGEYQAALNCYTEAGNIPGVGKLQRACYYKLAQKADEAGKDRKAMKLYRLAWYYSDAPEHTARLEKKLLRQAGIGDTVSFGGRNWTVLECQEDQILLFAKSAPQFHLFDKNGGAVWEKSTLKAWMDQSFLGGNFMKLEKEMVVSADQENENSAEKAFLLSSEEYYRYQDLIPDIHNRWWLRDNVIERNHAKCVMGDRILNIPADTEKIGVRPAMWVSITD